MQVQLIPFSKKYRKLLTLETLKSETLATDVFTKLGSLLIRDVSPLFCAGQSRG